MKEGDPRAAQPRRHRLLLARAARPTFRAMVMTPDSTVPDGDGQPARAGQLGPQPRPPGGYGQSDRPGEDGRVAPRPKSLNEMEVPSQALARRRRRRKPDQAALDLADSGYEVILVEKQSSIGGVMAQLDKTYPTMDCSI
jgi:hypothetical protein